MFDSLSPDQRIDILMAQIKALSELYDINKLEIVSDFMRVMLTPNTKEITDV